MLTALMIVKDGEVINGGYKTGANHFVYEVNSAKSDHSGVYSCVAESKVITSLVN